jgi:hypothetical protein
MSWRVAHDGPSQAGRPAFVRQLELLPANGLSQRWRDRKARWYRDHAGAPRLDPRRYHVQPIDQAAAAAWLARHHYLRTLAGRQWLYGLLDEQASDCASSLVGVAVFGPGMPNVLPALFAGLAPNQDSTELLRFGLLDDVPANGESYFLVAAFAILAHEGVAAVASFSDPVVRWSADGQIVAPGHVGTCYAAAGALYTGRTRPVTYRLFPDDAALLHPRMLAKYRAGDPNAGGVERALVAHGALARSPAEDPATYLDRFLPRLTLPFRHGGLHRYAFTIGPHARAVRLTRHTLPYPGRLPAGC